MLSVTEAQAQQTTAGLLPGAEAWYLRTTDRAGELFVYEIGCGEPVVVLHGGPGADFDYILPVADGLTFDYRFVFYDQRGSLRSRVRPDSISMAKHVQDLNDLRRALGVERIHLLSHSAGTMLAFEYLQAYPEHVGHVVLVGALPHKNGAPYFDEEYAALWEGLQDEAQAFYEREAVQRELRRVGVDDSLKTPKQRSQIALIRQVGAETFHVERWRERIPLRINNQAGQLTRASTNFTYDYSDLLADHAFPVTVINGEYDYTVGPRGSPLWMRLKETRAPDLSVIVIPDASHNVWYDDPARFRAALRKALPE
ncbi:MAG: alpha/beta hydrolase [Rubricoccaceae bacterium]